MNTKPTLAVAAVAALLLTACNADNPPSTIEGVPEPATVTVTATATETVTETVTAEPEPAPEPEPEPSSEAPAASGAMALGETLEIDGATITVVETQEGTDALDDPYVGYLVKSCNTGSAEIGFSQEPWVGVDADGGRYTATIAISGSLTPEYPMYNTMNEAVTAPGDCLSGWIPFEQGVTELRYRNDRGDTGAWTVG